MTPEEIKELIKSEIVSNMTFDVVDDWDRCEITIRYDKELLTSIYIDKSTR